MNYSTHLNSFVYGNCHYKEQNISQYIMVAIKKQFSNSTFMVRNIYKVYEIYLTHHT